MTRTALPRASTWCALLLGSLAVAPLAASFGDCNSTSYLASFDRRMATDTGFLCVESDRVPVRSDAGTTHIRLIQHLEADWAARPGALAAIQEGVAASALAMSRLGSFEISDVTILLMDSFGPDVTAENFGHIGAFTHMGAGDECRIALWLLGPGATEELGGAVVAHELFHCVQRSSLSPAQTSSGAALGAPASGKWWLEGSAEWFATLARPAPSYMPRRVTAFDHDSPTLPLHRMGYNAYPFFAWLAGAHGIEAVMPFLHAMASSSDEPAQEAAMAAALSAEEWVHFAEDYLDQRIRDGHGVSIGSTPLRGEAYAWEATRTQAIPLEPFVLARADLTVQCGRWRFAPAPATFHGARPEEGSAEWGPLPASLDAMDGERRYRFAGLAATSADVTLQVAGTREASCSECGGTREVDACLVGTWELTTHGPETWLRQRGAPMQGAEVRRANNTLTLREDGSFTTGAARVDADVRTTEGMQARGRMVGQTRGRWSAASGRFNVCQEATELAGTVTMEIAGQTVTAPARPGRPRDSSQPYTCDPTTLRVTMTMGAAGTVESVYTKVAPPH
jgi:hypothetical protein